MNNALHSDLLDGKTIFISGGGSGVNLAIAKILASVGADLSICGRTKSRQDSAALELRGLGADVVTTVADVRDREAVGMPSMRVVTSWVRPMPSSAAPPATSSLPLRALAATASAPLSTST